MPIELLNTMKAIVLNIENSAAETENRFLHKTFDFYYSTLHKNFF